MSAATQNHIYSYGKKRDGKEERTLSSEKLKKIRKSVEKYLPKKK